MHYYSITINKATFQIGGIMKPQISTKSILISLFFVTTSCCLFSAAKKSYVQIKTIPEAITYLYKAINGVPTDSSLLPTYEKEYADGMVKCAKVLYDNAHNQILDSLSEIDRRISYWQYQKDHPWKYFVSKNPLKWITGPKQEDEVESNLDTLKSHQGELYVLLGQLSELGTAFIRGYKDTFLTDYQKGYEWIDSLLAMLVRIKIRELPIDSDTFGMRIQKLQARLERVDYFKADLLSDISETIIPSYIERNWLTSGALLFGLNYGYKNYADQIVNAVVFGQKKGLEYIVDPVTTTIKDVLMPGWKTSAKNLFEQDEKNKVLPGNKGGENKIVSEMHESYPAKLEELKNYITYMGDKYGLQEEAHNVLKGFEEKRYTSYIPFLESIRAAKPIEKSWNPLKKAREFVAQNWEDYALGVGLGRELEIVRSIFDIEDFLKNEQKRYETYLLGKMKKYEAYALEQQKKYEDQYAAVGKVVLLIPAFLAATAGYLAYQKLTTKNYTSLRRALIDINYLFIDSSKPLNDEQYGKMVYLVYMLKKRAEKELPVKKNVRADFVADLEKIESPELNVAAKRALIEDMFKKYAFLGAAQSK